MPKISQQELMNRLGDLSKFSNEQFERINWGGCCVFAALVAEQLEALGIECEVITDTYDARPVAPDDVRAIIGEHWELRDWDSNGIRRGHMAVRFRAPDGRIRTYDSDGVVHHPNRFGEGRYNYRCSYGFGRGLTAAEARRMSIDMDGEGWNCCFDRSQIPDMAALAAETLGDAQ